MTAVGKGNATITVWDNDTKLTCKINVNDLSLNEQNINITRGKTFRLKVTGAQKAPEWTTSNAKIATVSKNGTITAKSIGSAIITAKIYGKKYSCFVTVKGNVATLPDNSAYCPANDAVLCFTKISFSGGSMVVEGYAVNMTRWKITGFIDTKLTIRNGNKLVAEQTYPNYSFSLSPNSKKKCKFVISSSNITDKSIDLRLGDMRVNYDGKYQYYY